MDPEMDNGPDSVEAMAAQLEDLHAENKLLRAFARDIAENWDHDSDAHKYGTPCRVCEATAVLKKGQ